MSLDLRTVKTGTTIELDTPHAAFTIENAGYYRVEVGDQNTSFTTRRGGRASVTPANGESAAVASSEQVVVSGERAAAARDLRRARARRVGSLELHAHRPAARRGRARATCPTASTASTISTTTATGAWCRRTAPSGCRAWPPAGRRTAPARGSSDPYYGWTWVDAAPWGWAPFHYGRWVRVGGYWGWAPGPLVARPYYAPALVAFFDVPSVTFGVSFGHAATSWVALGWGEPCSRGGARAAGAATPHWVGWGGPRVVNNVVINNTTIVNVNEVNDWSNADHHGAVVGVSRDQFGRGRIQHAALRPGQGREVPTGAR